jgi:hypothetical protein
MFPSLLFIRTADEGPGPSIPTLTRLQNPQGANTAVSQSKMVHELRVHFTNKILCIVETKEFVLCFRCNLTYKHLFLNSNIW